jgi:hypothetical protein
MPVEPLRVWWLSFADDDHNLGVIVVDAVDFEDALAKVYLEEIHPGGQCLGRGEAPELYPPTKRAIVAAIPRLTLLSVQRLQHLGVNINIGAADDE